MNTFRQAPCGAGRKRKHRSQKSREFSRRSWKRGGQLVALLRERDRLRVERRT